MLEYVGVAVLLSIVFTLAFYGVGYRISLREYAGKHPDNDERLFMLGMCTIVGVLCGAFWFLALPFLLGLLAVFIVYRYLGLRHLLEPGLHKKEK